MSEPGPTVRDVQEVYERSLRSGVVAGLMGVLRARDDEIARLRQLLGEYGRHGEGCSAAHGPQYRCRCGWREIEPEFTQRNGT